MALSNVTSGDVKVTGMKELIKSLRKLPTNIQKNIMASAMLRGANTIRDEARELVPKDTGTLKKSIKARRRKSRDKDIVHFTVAPLTKDMWRLQDKKGERHYNYASHIEFGKDGVPPQPFMRPAFENNGDKAVKATGDYLRKRLDDEVKKSRVN